MKLGKWQKLAILLGIVLVVAVILFPPQKEETRDGAVRAGRKFLFAADKKIDNLKDVKLSDLSKLKPDLSRLSTEVIVIGIATVVGVIVIGAFTAVSKSR